ncbi:uncharacterized protein FA14DRAFT_127674 [Meira miltonrushii]|uniref:DinB-like domain-containing protein n=1 Tax=Meira miltonrushii TaxID=1280837 RepID=A0A316V3L3_9BASI|nr:uncharacterized protein FA14DRAFT_127674 [Meira miltonrushii]PWN31844.1 hypothetical protein FA14DRAFT_127674 [Meira miltonrushii]
MERNSHEAGPSSASVNLEATSREEARQTIVASLVQILDQPLAMLRDGTVGDQQMRAESRLIPGSTLGKHLRHVHDHYRVLLDSIESSSKRNDGGDEGIDLDYDKRTRVVPLETSAKSALQEFESTIDRIQRIFNRKQGQDASWDVHLDRHVRLSATTPAEIELSSSLGRELWFVCLHAIHHYALARVILVHELGLQINDSFGVAPSTMVMRLWRQASSQWKSKL